MKCVKLVNCAAGLRAARGGGEARRNDLPPQQARDDELVVRVRAEEVPVRKASAWSRFWCAGTGSSGGCASAMARSDEPRFPFGHSRSDHEWLFVIIE